MVPHREAGSHRIKQAADLPGGFFIKVLNIALDVPVDLCVMRVKPAAGCLAGIGQPVEDFLLVAGQAVGLDITLRFELFSQLGGRPVCDTQIDGQFAGLGGSVLFHTFQKINIGRRQLVRRAVIAGQFGFAGHQVNGPVQLFDQSFLVTHHLHHAQNYIAAKQFRQGRLAAKEFKCFHQAWRE
ncbi:hypothetical protein SDC9_193269 [bioreactor metagenome]|uniref:Uncharacterized protein n=1 Tax=bioreactor metagenome TaxID=1076179 RepID=A0A645I3L1_9ZZZZ